MKIEKKITKLKKPEELLDELDTWYKQHIKENYIRKDSFSIEKLEKIMDKVKHYDGLAPAIIKSIKGDK